MFMGLMRLLFHTPLRVLDLFCLLGVAWSSAWSNLGTSYLITYQLQ